MACLVGSNGSDPNGCCPNCYYDDPHLSGETYPLPERLSWRLTDGHITAAFLLRKLSIVIQSLGSRKCVNPQVFRLNNLYVRRKAYGRLIFHQSRPIVSLLSSSGKLQTKQPIDTGWWSSHWLDLITQGTPPSLQASVEHQTTLPWQHAYWARDKLKVSDSTHRYKDHLCFG